MDSTMIFCRTCQRLETLFRNRTLITDAGMKELAGLTRLTTLSLNATGVSDTGLKT